MRDLSSNSICVGEQKVIDQEAKLAAKLDNDFLDKNIDWSRSIERVETLVDWIENYLLKKEYHHHSKGCSSFLYLLFKSWYIWQDLALLFSVLINVLILVYAYASPLFTLI